MFDSLLGPPGQIMSIRADGTTRFDETVFSLLFHFICFFCMLNFFLAIIVDAYTKVCVDIEECSVENNVLSDLWYLAVEYFLRVRHRWPPRHAVIHHLNLQDHVCITTKELYDA